MKLQPFSGKTISRMIGRAARTPLPPIVIKRLIHWYIRWYRVNMEEVAQPLDSFRCMDEFFTREIDPRLRPIDPSPMSVVSPVDGLVVQHGPIEESKLIQAKGIDYSLDDLIPTPRADAFRGGSFINFYLSPADCHRIFSPVEGRVAAAVHVPGMLLPVRRSFQERAPGLYTRNERLITFMETNRGDVAVVKVGAFNVGNISVEYDAELRTNLDVGGVAVYDFPHTPAFNRGRILGAFHMGSSVILAFPPGAICWVDGLADRRVRYGEAIAHWT